MFTTGYQIHTHVDIYSHWRKQIVAHTYKCHFSGVGMRETRASLPDDSEDEDDR
ncbi:Bgt-20397 [Blumeria graminis f. sp. tritici]|uniref:Bgt-20397 n=2 Tax=Blumeria graminis f. sp. tritici TaxID=62690 RepID=A0A381L2H5_BLUGR|nr:Bgt-20397 [Blumeria graminis f. sp. tritici]